MPLKERDTGSPHEEFPGAGRIYCRKCGWLTPETADRVYHADYFHDSFCKFCQLGLNTAEAHTHDGGYVCDACWDERLRSTE